MNPWVSAEQRKVERFVKCEYWRLASLGDGRFAFTRAPLSPAASASEETR